MEYKQDPPFALQIELVEGCTLACTFCGINGIRTMPGMFKFMTMETAEDIVVELARLNWNPRIEFAMHGEPSLHPQRNEIISLFRRKLGKNASMVMFSNGSGFLTDASARINGLLEAGLNTLGLDAYEHVNIVPRVMEQYDGKYPVHKYPMEIDQNLHSGRRVGHRDIVVIKDIVKAEAGNHSKLNTHCGGGKEPGEVLQRRCAKPFRELSIRWDGNVAICCNDFRGIYKIGGIDEMPLDAIWNHSRFMAARKMLMQSDRNFDPCRHCNATSMRVGLLPDKKGKVDLGPVLPEDRQQLQEAVSGSPYTVPVLRKWEVPTTGGTPRFPMQQGGYDHNVYPDKEGPA